MSHKDIVVKGLAAEGMTLADYGRTVFVVIDGEVVADSETVESASTIVDRAQDRGEWAFAYMHAG